jgi:hypothetical protein
MIVILDKAETPPVRLRTFGVVFLPILHYIHLFQQRPEEYYSLLHVVSADALRPQTPWHL